MEGSLEGSGNPSKEVGTLLAAKHFISHTPVPVMDLPIADVVDSKEHLRFRAMCDERISFPFEELRGFRIYVASEWLGVATRGNGGGQRFCLSEAGPLYKKLGYSDMAIKAFGLDPGSCTGIPFLPAAAHDADPTMSPPLLMEYPDQPRPPITVENQEGPKTNARFGPRLSAAWFCHQ